MLFSPTAYTEVKVVLLGALLFGVVVGSLNGARFCVQRQVFVLFVFYSGMGAAYVLYGYLNGNPGAVKVVTVYVLWPLVYLILVSAISRTWMIRRLMQVLVGSSLAIPLYALYYLLFAVGVIPGKFYVELDLGQGASFSGGFAEYNLYSVSTLLFLFPFVTACIVLWSGERDAPVARGWLVLAFVLLTAASILSGRRALWLVMALTLPLLAAILFLSGQGRQMLKKTVAFFPFFSAVVVFTLTIAALELEVNPLGVWEVFMRGFNFSSDDSAVARSEQFSALVQGWLSSPIFGAGLGAVAEGSIRSKETPWAYELYFLSVLFQTGLAGFLAYALGIGWIIVYALWVIRRDPMLRLYMTPVLVGMLCFLIASNSNPYLPKFDFLWVVFLPVALINYALLENSRAPRTGAANGSKNGR